MEESLTIITSENQCQEESETGKKTYNLIAGLERSKSLRRLAFTLPDGYQILEPYHAIKRIEWTEQGDTMTLHLLHNSMMVCLGDNLHYLLRYLRAETLPHLYCFDPVMHVVGEGTAEMMPVIYQIQEVPKEL